MHLLIGTAVKYFRPVIKKASTTKTDENDRPVVTPAVVEITETPGIIIGVAAVETPIDGSPAPPPRLTIAFAHPERLIHVGGSGWREAFDRTVDVRPSTDPVVEAGEKVGFYGHQIVVDYRAARAKFQSDQRTAEKKAAKDAKNGSNGSGDTPASGS